VARPPARRPGADKPKSESSDFSVDESAATDAVADEGDVTRTPQVDAFWERVRIDPVEIALPDGAGYTLRAYRMDSDVTPSDYSGREDVEFPDRTRAYIDDDVDGDEEDLDDDEAGDLETVAAELDDEGDEDEAEDDEDEDALEAAAAADEEVPLFLSHAGELLVFRSRSGLVKFVQSDAEHDLTQLDEWSRFVSDVRPEYIVATADDTYELDLVVKNLRGSHDVWDPALIVQSGQFARDLGHALRIERVVLALSPGSPLDDLDEALRGVAAGGVGTFFARRKAKKIGTETASLGWRTVIGKISAVVDWRD
jgi:hypothetical protein